MEDDHAFLINSMPGGTSERLEQFKVDEKTTFRRLRRLVEVNCHWRYSATPTAQCENRKHDLPVCGCLSVAESAVGPLCLNECVRFLSWEEGYTPECIRLLCTLFDESRELANSMPTEEWSLLRDAYFCRASLPQTPCYNDIFSDFPSNLLLSP